MVCGDHHRSTRRGPSREPFGRSRTAHRRAAAQPSRVVVAVATLARMKTANAKFRSVVDATSYATLAERAPSAEDYPGAIPERLVPGSVLFRKPATSVDRNHYNWWMWMAGADWRHPSGPSSSIRGLHRPNYCLRYRPAARIGHAIDTGTCHLGFRCVVRAAASP